MRLNIEVLLLLVTILLDIYNGICLCYDTKENTKYGNFSVCLNIFFCLFLASYLFLERIVKEYYSIVIQGPPLNRILRNTFTW